MATVGQHTAAAVVAINALRDAVEALTDELQAVRVELESLNGKVPAAVDGKLPALVTANGAMPVTTDQLPGTLQGGKLKVTGLL